MLEETSRAVREGGGDIRFDSAGIEAVEGAAVCSVFASSLGERAADHRAKRASSDVISRSALIITASHVERTEIARRDRDARTKVFTLREAAALGEFGVETGAFSLAEPTVSEFAAVLDGLRGRVLPKQPPRWSFGRSLAGGWDVPDAHTTRAGHSLVRRLIEESSRSLAQTLLSVAGS